ncbi:MAG: glycosyltransferase [Actinomycetota bacterium]
MTGPSVSVVLPVLDGEHFIMEAVGSVLEQTFSGLELIVVDDGSTDATGELVLGVKDPRVRYLRQENRGLAAARNRGVSEASAPAVAFIDADDRWKASKLEKQLPVLAKGLLVYSDVELSDETGRSLGGFRTFDRFPEDERKFSGDVLTALLAQNFVHPSTVVMRKEDLAAVGGFREELRVSEDWDLWLRCAEGMRFSRLAEPLVAVLIRRESLQGNPQLMRATSLRVLHDAGRRLREDGRMTAEVRGALGLGYFSSRNMRPAAANLFGAALRRPWHLRWWKWLASSLLWRPVRGDRATVADSEILVRGRK